MISQTQSVLAGFESNAEFFSDYADGITCELFDTGSVEVEIGDRTFLLSLIISEERTNE